MMQQQMQRMKVLLAAALPIALGLLLTAYGNMLRYGAFTLPSSGNFVVAGYVGPLLRERDGEGTELEGLLAELAAQTKEQQARLADANWPQDYVRASREITTPLAFAVYFWHIYEHLGGTLPDDKKANYLRFKEVNAVATEAAWIIIKAHPLEYLKLVTANLWTLWHRDFLGYPDPLPRMMARDGYHHSRWITQLPEYREYYLGLPSLNRAYYTDAAAGARHDARAGDITLPDYGWHLVHSTRLWLVAAFWLVSIPLLLYVGARLLARRRCGMTLWLPAYLALLLHGCALFIVMTHFPTERYALPLTPLLFLFLVSIIMGGVVLGRMVLRPVGRA